MRTIVEDLNYAKQEPSSQAAMQAQQLGLAYVGFGRYEDPKTNQVTHIVQNDRLVPFRKAIKTNTYRTKQSDDMGNLATVLSPEAEEVHNTLAQAYDVNAYDEKEINAISTFVNVAYSDINDLLSKFPAGTAASKIMPEGVNDDRPDIISSLDSVMKKSRSPIEFITYTKLDSSVDKMDLSIGKKIKFKGFKNTTISLGNILVDPDPSSLVLQIRIKKNSRGLYTSEFSETPEENEFLLPRGAKVEIISGPIRLVGSDGMSGGMNKELYYYDSVVKT